LACDLDAACTFEIGGADCMDHAGPVPVGGPVRPLCWPISLYQSNSFKPSCDACLVVCHHVTSCHRYYYNYQFL